MTAQICEQGVLGALVRHTHCNSVQRVDSNDHTANVPARQKELIAPLGHSWKRLVAEMASTVVEMDAIDPVVTALVVEPARVIAEPGMAALQMPSARH